ncbi:swr1 complex component [Mortierella antarctica]|nr:swr1 complex component [Mortierella antarctica]
MSSESDPVALPHATAEQTRDSESEAHTIRTANTSASSRPSSHVEPEPSNTDMPRRQDPALATELNTSHNGFGQGDSVSTSLDTDSLSSEPAKTISQSPPTDGAKSFTSQPDSSYTTSAHPFTNGVSSSTESKNQIIPQATLVPSNPVKRGPGRPPRSLMTKPADNPNSSRVQEPTRLRRTLRAATVSHTAGRSTSVMHVQHKESESDRGSQSASLTQTRTAGQRTSTRHIRTPAKYSDSVTATSRATPANQKSLINRQPSPPEPVMKRGPGRPVSNPHSQHRTVRSPPSPPLSAPVVPAKRGPGRPPRNPFNPLTVKPAPQVETSQLSKTKSKSASPTMARSSNGQKTSPTSPRSANSTPGGIQVSLTKRGPGRPKRSDSTSSPSSPSSWRYPNDTQIVAPSPNTSSSRSLKRHHKSDVDEEEASNISSLESGLTPRKKRVMSLTEGPVLPPKAKEVLVPRILTPLDKARDILVAEWEGKLHEVIDHHDSLARELYHLETAQNTLTYDPVKIKADHNEKMLRFLRKFDLWSQVPELVSSVQISTDRISTRRSAVEKREQLVDLLQKNVEGALPKRPDLLRDTDLIRRHSPYTIHAQFVNLEDYLDSFVYADEEEVTPEESDRRAEVHAELLDRIDELKSQGRLKTVEPIRPFIDPEVPKLHYNWLMEHIMTSSRLIKREGELQIQRARKVSKMILRHFEILHGKSEREQREEEKRIKKLAKLTSNEVKKKWRYVEGIVHARHKALLKEEQEEAGKRHLNLILEHSTQILEVQQSTLVVSTPGTPSTPAQTPGTPGQSESVASPSTMSDVVSEMPSATEPSSRQSSIAPSVAPSVDSPQTDVDAGDDAEFAVTEMDADDETTLAQDESGSEDDEAEINGLAAEMDIPIEELLRQYGYQISGDEGSDDDDESEEGDDQKQSQPTNHVRPVPEEKSAMVVNEEEVRVKSEPDGSPADIEMEPVSDLKDVFLNTDVQMEVEPSTSKTSNTQTTRTPSAVTNSSVEPIQESGTLDSKKIASALPEGIKAANKSNKVTERAHPTKRRRLSLTGLYRGPPLPYNPYGEVDDERTIEEDEQDENSTNDPIEVSMLMREKDMPIEELLDRFAYEASSSEYSDSYYDSDSDDEGSVMSAQQRIKRADPRFVVTLQDVATSRKFPTRPNSDITDTDTEYDDNRTISIYGSDDELCLGDMLPLLDPIVHYESEEDEAMEAADEEEVQEIDTSATGANVKTKVPFLLRHTLREYQHVGMDWLANLYSNGLNGILADEMGLGKTMQTIALLAHLACEHGVWGPHLIVVPTSVMLNWEMEFKKWCPGFKIMTYYGSPRERKEKRIGWTRENSFHVCITSYQLVVQDQTVFRRKAWQYLILDEAHNIKNFRSQRWQTLLNFNSARRLLLTGTPLQNNLMELWSLLYFLMPNGVSETMPVGFANQKEFQEWFSHPVDRMIEGNEQQDEDSKAAIARLHTVLRPYLLRRLKADVETQMPAKYEHIVYCRLSKRQRFLYDDFMSRAKTRETLASGNFLSIINCLMQLRKVCNHPDLFEVRPIVTSFAMPSAIASFDTTEFLVRRRMFSEIDQAREAVNLEFLGLVFTGAEQSLSRLDMESMQGLSASSCLSRKATEFVVPQAKTLQNSNHYQDIRQYEAMRRHRILLANRQRWEQLEYVNTNRCNVRVMYGSSLLEMVCAPTRMRVGCRAIPDQVANPRMYLKYTDALARAIVPSETRFLRNEETLKRFAFVTPAVMVRSQTWNPIHVNPSPSSLEVACEKAKDLFHPVESCLQVQFPDKRLLQFDCGKLQKLDSLLRELKSGGHRALIFTQMTKVLDILEIFLNIHGHRYLRLDGATKVENRQHLTDRFNSDPKILAFILSTRSGGVGINLTGADTVIFYDSDWNPSMDRQCQDRCHRIGQTRDVHIYRFVSEFTIEENMLKKANQKRMLDNVVIQEGGFTTDYFQKMDWRDMLGEDDLAKIGDLGPVQPNGEPMDLSTVHGADLEQALAAAEDENDVLAMQQAKHEMEGVDVGDFSEAGAGAGTPVPTAQNTKIGKSLGDTQSRVHFASGEAAAGDEEVIEMGHVDEYMLRFAEMEYGHYVGFGGLPEPPKKEYGTADEDMEEAAEEEEEEAEEEDEEEEEEDEYDVEDSESDGPIESGNESEESDKGNQRMDLD